MYLFDYLFKKKLNCVYCHNDFYSYDDVDVCSNRCFMNNNVKNEDMKKYGTTKYVCEKCGNEFDGASNKEYVYCFGCVL